MCLNCLSQGHTVPFSPQYFVCSFGLVETSAGCSATDGRFRGGHVSVSSVSQLLTETSAGCSATDGRDALRDAALLQFGVHKCMKHVSSVEPVSR